MRPNRLVLLVAYWGPTPGISPGLSGDVQQAQDPRFAGTTIQFQSSYRRRSAHSLRTAAATARAEQHWLTAEREILESAKPAIPAKRTVAKKANRLLARPVAKAAAAVIN
jgi:hypothetical protein